MPATSPNACGTTFKPVCKASWPGTSSARTPPVRCACWPKWSRQMSSADTHWGLWLHAVRPAAELAELAAAAEGLGAAAVLVADEGCERELFVTLAILSPWTRRVM